MSTVTTPRPYVSLPKGETIDTPFGPVFMQPCGRDQIFVEAGGSFSDYRDIVINGVAYTMYARFYLQPDGEWRIGPGGDSVKDYEALNIRRRNWTNYGQSYPSNAARKKFLAAIVPIVDTWAKANGPLLAAADLAERQQEAHRIERDIAEAEAKLATLRAKLAELGV